MCPDCVDFFAEGEMQRMGCICYLPGMACAAGCPHVRRVTGPGNQAGMGLIDLVFIVETAMAGGAGQGVGRIKLDFDMASCATGCSGGDRCWLGSGSF